MLDFRRMADRYNLPHIEEGHHHCHQGWVQTHCPFCAGGRGGWHLGFSLEKGNFACWRCGSLRFWEVLEALLRMDEGRVRQVVSEYQLDGPRYVKMPVARQRRISPPPGAGPLEEPHLRYLASRNFDGASLAQEWGLLGTGPGGKWQWRIIIPIRNGDDRIVAYQGRSIGDSPQRYKMTDDKDCLEDPMGFVYGIDKVRGDSILIVEGAPGVWRLGPGAVGTLSSSWRLQQMNKLRRFKRRFVLYDPEPKAQKQARQLAEHLSLFPGDTEILSGFDTDPGDFSDDQVLSIRKELGM